jgi:hypothetical protein
MSEQGKMDSGFRGNDGKATNKRKVPRWATAFLRALERCGDARASAEDAGIDHTTAYARRKAHADFAEAWAAALAAHKARREREEAEELAAFKAGLATSPQPRSREGTGAEDEELVLVNGRMKRVAREGWGKRKEKRFFDELMATNNIRRAAKAAGVSENAVHQRRLRHPLFRAKWEAVEQCAKTGMAMYLLEATRNTFDPGTLQVGGVTPKVSIAEAIRIVGGSARGAGPALPMPMPMADPSVHLEADEELRERLARKFLRLRERLNAERVGEGWGWDEEHRQPIPPGWMRGAGPAASA